MSRPARMEIGRGRGIGAVVVSVAVMVVWVATDRAEQARPISAPMSIGEALATDDTAGFERALRARAFEFPEDHGAHPGFRNEWWYVTANVEAEDGRAFGVQWTVFRTALAPASPTSVGAGWSTTQAYMGHFAVADVERRRHHRFERIARGALGLAGAAHAPFRVWLEDWELRERPGESAFPAQLRAREAGVAVELELNPLKPLVLQGDSGLSRKGPGEGDASYYYSFTRLAASGVVEIEGVRLPVSGTAWLDREWGTSALSPDQVGWDWFALQLSDGRDLMLYQLRGRDGTADPWSSGTLVDGRGRARSFDLGSVELRPTGTWTSSSGAVYPSGWRVTVPEVALALEIVPLLADQEMDLTVRYWEGAVRATGTAAGKPVSGRGFVELTGYDGPGGGGEASRTPGRRLPRGSAGRPTS